MRATDRRRGAVIGKEFAEPVLRRVEPPHAVVEEQEDARGAHWGNPFFTGEIVQGLVETGSLEGTRGAYRGRESSGLSILRRMREAGAPIAHEDHAQRACYGTLHLQQGLSRYADELRLERGLNFSVRMGLNSGVGTAASSAVLR